MNKLVNEANWDRIARAILGLALVITAFTGVVPGAWGIVLAVLGLVALVTGAIGFCPLYRLFNFRTN